MVQIGLMVEGQDGTTWERWAKLLQAAEDFGYQCLFRSDHFTNATAPDKESLECWVSLTYAATISRRIEFGPLVSPITFRHPALLARMAAAVDDLSGGRLVFGLGAGWQNREHHKFGIPFYDFPTRYAMLAEALEMISRLFKQDQPVSFSGQYYSLDEASLLPRPHRPGGPPILIGGSGPTRTLPLVAAYADEWNAVYIPLETYRQRVEQLNVLMEQQGRKLDSIKRSLMTGCILAQDEANLRNLLAARGKAETVDELKARGILIGTAADIVEQIGGFAEAGVQRFMLQWLDQDNIADLEIIARDVLPHFHNSSQH